MISKLPSSSNAIGIFKSNLITSHVEKHLGILKEFLAESWEAESKSWLITNYSFELCKSFQLHGCLICKAGRWDLLGLGTDTYHLSSPRARHEGHAPEEHLYLLFTGKGWIVEQATVGLLTHRPSQAWAETNNHKLSFPPTP